MALDFPASPTNGQTYTSGVRTWMWNSTTSTWNSTNTYSVTKLISGAYTALPGDILGCNTTAGGFTITLPTTPTANTKVVIFDAGATNVFDGFYTNNLIVARNGSTIQYSEEDVVLNIKGITVSFEYIGTTWIVRNGGDLVNYTVPGVPTWSKSFMLMGA